MAKLYQYQQWSGPLSQDAGFVETVTLDKWFQAASQPVFKVPPRQVGYQVLVLDLPNPIVDFGWYAPPSEPLFVAPAVQPMIATSFVLPAVVASDSVTVIIDLVDENLR